jgi:hypothetical protein
MSASSQKSTIVTVVAIYSLILAIFSLCVALPVIGLGSLTGSLGQIASQTAQELSAEEQQALAVVSGAGGALVTILGLLFLVIAIALLVDAVGLFQSKPWSWMLTVVLYGIYVVLTVINWISNSSFNILGLVFVVIAALIIFLFWTNADVKRTLGKV